MPLEVLSTGPLSYLIGPVDSTQRVARWYKNDCESLLCYSGAPMVLAYRRQNEESFLEALVRVLQYFGGVPWQVIFDNDKVAVKDGFGAHARRQDNLFCLVCPLRF